MTKGYCGVTESVSLNWSAGLVIRLLYSTAEGKEDRVVAGLCPAGTAQSPVTTRTSVRLDGSEIRNLHDKHGNARGEHRRCRDRYDGPSQA
jgi:hypothetical protein